MIGTKNKTCIKCGKELPAERFEKSSNTRDGRINVCGACRHEARKVRPSWGKRKNRSVEAARTWREDNSDYMKNYCKKNKDRIRESQIRSVENNPEYYAVIRKTAARANCFIRANNIDRKDHCQYCGKLEKTDMHHPDYNKAYEVVFLCRRCHKRVHSNLIQCPQPINLELMTEQG